MEIGTVPIIGVVVGINDGMYKKDSARFQEHIRCSINVNTFRAAEVTIMVMTMIGKEVSELQGVWGVSFSCCPTPQRPSGEKGRSQLITGGGWGGGVRLESLLGLFAASLFH